MWVIYTIGNLLFKFLDSKYFKKDLLWEETKKKIVFRKIRQVFYFIILSCIFLWYFIYTTERQIASGKFLLFYEVFYSVNLSVYIDYRKFISFYFVYFFCWLVIFLLSFFVRKIHEAVYRYGPTLFMLSWLYLLYYGVEYWYQIEDNALEDINWVLFLYTFIYSFIGTWIHLETDLDNDEDEIEFMANFNDNIWLERNKNIIDDLLYEKEQEEEIKRKLTESYKPQDYAGDLNDIPSAYSVDPKADIEEIIFLKKKQIEDEKDYGLSTLLNLRGRIFRLYPTKSVTQNYVLNIKKVLYLAFNFWNSEIIEGESIIEIEARYKRERILRSPAARRTNLLGLSEEDKLIELSDLFTKEHFYLEAWDSPAKCKDMTQDEAMWFKWWVSDQVPFVVKIFVILKRFYLEYKVGLIKAKKKNGELLFRDALYSYFGKKWEKEHFIVKYPNGYVGWVRGQPKFVHMYSLDFDEELYNKPIPTLPKISTQFLNIFKNGFKYLKNIFMFFFYLITSWGSFAFWGYVIRSSIYIPKMIINLIVRIYNKIVRYFMKKYTFFFINFLPFLNYLRSLIFYILFNLISRRFFLKKTEPAGPYSVYTPMLKFKKMYVKKPFYFLFNLYKIKRMSKSIKESLRKSKKRKLFLLWSRYNKKTK